MRWPEQAPYRGVVPGALILVFDQQSNGGSGRDTFKYARENSYSIRLATLGRVFRLTRLAPIKIPLQIGFIQFEPWRTAIHHAAKRGPVALTKGCYAKGASETATRHVVLLLSPLAGGRGV